MSNVPRVHLFSAVFTLLSSLISNRKREKKGIKERTERGREGEAKVRGENEGQRARKGEREREVGGREGVRRERGGEGRGG